MLDCVTLLDVAPQLLPVVVTHPPAQALVADKEAVTIPVKDSFIVFGELLRVGEWLHC